LDQPFSKVENFDSTFLKGGKFWINLSQRWKILDQPFSKVENFGSTFLKGGKFWLNLSQMLI